MDYPRGVRPSGAGIEIRFRYKGQEYYQYVAESPTKTNIAKAARLAKEWRERVKHGVVANERDNPAFETVAQDFLNSEEVAVSTRDSYRQILNQFWMPHFGGIPIRNIDLATVKKAIKDIAWTSSKTKKNAIVPLRGVFKLALHSDFIDHSPIEKLKKVKLQAPEVDPFTLEEKSRILDALRGLDADAHVFFQLAFCGFRPPGELLALEWADYNKADRTMFVGKAVVRRQLKLSTKTSVSRTVLLPSSVCDLLNNYPTRFKRSYIFLNSFGRHHLDGDRFNEVWREALKLAGVRYRRAYNCRHTYASLGLTAGVRPGFLAGQLGHSLEMFFRTYAKWNNGEGDRAEMAKIEAIGKW